LFDWGISVTTRTELPWDSINAEVVAATKVFCRQQFVSTKRLAEYVIENASLYPTLANTRKCTTSRITMSMRRMKWVSWSGLGSGKQKVFIIPEAVYDPRTL
jgi:hypothetical protein